MGSCESSRRAPLKGLANKWRSACAKVQRIFYAPVPLTPCDLCDKFATAQTEYILNYSNNVIKLTQGGGSFYFKQARKRLRLREYIWVCIDDFFDNVGGFQLRSSVCKSLESKGNFKKLLKMGDKDDVGSPLNKYLECGDARLLGLPECEGEQAGEVRKFIFYIYGELNGYNLNFGVKRNEIHTFLATRSIAAKMLADKLKIGRIIPPTRFVKMRLHGEEVYGTLEEEAGGVSVAGISPTERQRHITPELLRELSCLELLDALTRDDDHRANNYNVTLGEKGGYAGVISYDNDGPNAFFPSPRLRKTYGVNCSPLVDKRGRINRAHLDKTLAEALLGMDRQSLEGFSRGLNKSQLRCLWARIKKVQKAIKKSCENEDFLKNTDGWTEEDIQEDLSGKYGKTYLSSFIHDCYYVGGLHPYDRC